MAEDKFAPKPEDGTKRVHEIHRELLRTFRDHNKKKRAEAQKKVEVPKATPTQQETPQNPEALQNQPIEEIVSK